MRICLDMRTGAGCGTENLNYVYQCSKCGKALRFALMLHDAKTLVGRYRIVRVIGYGAYGAVYEATERNQSQTSPLIMLSRYLLGKTEPDEAAQRVALKETFDASSISSFAREFSVLSGLNHANLPRYLDMFEADGNGYLVMEYVPGQSLQEILDGRTDLLPESQVLGYALQLCDVLEYLHSQQPPILHRDIKPANIRLTPEGRIKLVDFGLLKQAGYQTRATIRGLGTPAYAPIEQYGDNQQATEPRSDIYSLGATLYHLLSGQEPLSAPNRLASDNDPLSPLQLTLSYVSFAVMKAMSLMPRERFANISEFRQALTGRYEFVQEASEDQPLDLLVQIPLAPADGRELEEHELFYPEQKEASQDESVPEIAVSQQPKKDEAPIQTPAVAVQRSDQDVEDDLTEQKEALAAMSPDQIIAKLSSSGTTKGLVTSSSNFSPYLRLSTSFGLISLNVDPTGKTLFAITYERILYQWRVVDGKRLAVQTLPAQSNLSAAAMSADMQKIATASRGVVQVWQAEEMKTKMKMKLLFEFREHLGDIQHLAFRPDGQVLAATARGKLWLWQMSDGQLLCPMRRFSRPLRSLIYSPSPDGQKLVADTSEDFYILDAANGQTISRITPKPAVMDWHPVANICAGGGNDCLKNVYLWQQDGQIINRFEIPEKRLYALKWGPTYPQTLAGASRSYVYLWILTDPILHYKCKINLSEVVDIDYALNGQVLVASERPGYIYLWKLSEILSDAERQEMLVFSPSKWHGGPVPEIAVSQPKDENQDEDEAVIEPAKNRDEEIEPLNRSPERPFQEPLITRLPHLVPYLVLEATNYNFLICLAVDTAGETVFAITDERIIHQWRVIDGKLLIAETLPGEGGLTAAAMSADTLKMAVANREVVQVWERKRMKLLFELPTHPFKVQHLAFSPDEQVLAGVVGSQLWLWQMNDGQLVKQQRFPHSLDSCVYSPDGQKMACKTSDAFYLLDAANGESIHQIEPRPSMITWQPDGQMFAGCGSDCGEDIYFWRSDGQVAGKLEVDKQDLTGLKFISTDTASLIAATKSGEIYLWDEAQADLRYICKTNDPHVQYQYLDYALNGRVLVAARKYCKVYLWQLPKPSYGEDRQQMSVYSEAIREPEEERLASIMPLLSGKSTPNLIENRSNRWSLNPIYDHQATKVAAHHALGLPHLICQVREELKALTFTVSGERLIGASKDGQILVWRASDGYLVKFLSLFEVGELHSFALSPNGQTMATTRKDDSVVCIWRTHDGQLLHQLSGHRQPVTSLAYTSNGQVLASADETSVRFWRVTDGICLEAYLNLKDVESIGISPDSKIIAIACGGNLGIQLWSLKKGNCLRSLNRSSNKVIWSPNGQLLAAESSYGNLALWYRKRRRFKLLKGHKYGIYDIAWHPTGEMIATGSWDKTIRLWSLDEPSLLYVGTGHTNDITQVAISPDGGTLASSCKDKTMRLWQIPKEHPVVAGIRHYASATSQESQSIHDIQLARDFYGYSIKKFKVSKKRSFPHIRCQLGSAIVNLAYRADGKTIICADDNYNIYYLRAKDGKLKKITPLPCPPELDAIAFSPNGETIATASEDMIIRLWRSNGQLLYELRAHNAPIKGLAFSPDGQTFASAGSHDESVRLWNVSDGRPLHLFEGQDNLDSVAYRSDGRMLAIGSSHGGEKIQLRVLATGKRVPLEFGGWYKVHSLAWNPNGQYFATAQEEQLFLWNATNGQLIKKSKKHTRGSYRLNSVAFNPDGQTVASGSTNKKICIYSSKELEILHRWQAHEKEVTCLAYSPDGRVLASAGKDGTVRLWELAN